MSSRLDRLAPAGLENLETLWDGELDSTFAAYAEATTVSREPVALAAALVETAIRIQRLGSGMVASAPLLLGDLCLARASRLLADVGESALQIAFARIVQDLASAAAEGRPMPHVRPRLMEAVAGRC
ncbi:MAG: hypothetical protein ACREPA_02770 [Candidatus Dormibacteraceae bacterium]